ncbi:MAG: hypothetical protein ACI8TP_003524 [Acidimicrobiales bacterium]|jgi:hypothetical protein
MISAFDHARHTPYSSPGRHTGLYRRATNGFAGYFFDDWHHDHVIAEAWLDGQWQRFDAEVEAPLR